LKQAIGLTSRTLPLNPKTKLFGGNLKIKDGKGANFTVLDIITAGNSAGITPYIQKTTSSSLLNALSYTMKIVSV
jgi:hypothetical protein